MDEFSHFLPIHPFYHAGTQRQGTILEPGTGASPELPHLPDYEKYMSVTNCNNNQSSTS
jgi:hypothetical protein